MRMVFEYEDGVVFVTRNEYEEDCVSKADMYTEKHGSIVYYSEIEEDSLFYPEDGLQ